MYFGVVTEASVIGSIDQQTIFKIEKARLIPMDDRNTQNVRDVETLLQSGFYFSRGYDLTLSSETAAKKPQRSLHDRANPYFYWNFRVLSQFIESSVDHQWLIPIIHGYVGITQFQQGQHSTKMALISRKSIHNTRGRGLDKNGNSADYIQTEQIVQINSCHFSFIQIRGSIPIYWKQTGPSEALVCQKLDYNSRVFQIHLQYLWNDYRNVIFINLLDQSNSSQRQLTKNWHPLLQQGSNSGNKLQYLQTNSIQDLLAQLRKQPGSFAYYTKPVDYRSSTQISVIRTSCFDCLDRTSIAQSHLAWEAISQQMRTAGFDNFYVTIQDSENTVFGKMFKALWLTNGDSLSIQAVGSPCSLSIVAGENKNELMSLINPEGIKYKKSRLSAVETLLKKQRQPGLSLRVVTWNLAGRKIDNNTDLRQLLTGSYSPDLIVLSLQEVVKLNAMTVINENSNQNRLLRLRGLLHRFLPEYNLILEENLVGCAIFLMSKNSVSNLISEPFSDRVKVGFKGNLGNKGAVLIRFNILEHSICVYNCHLASGKDNDSRKSQLTDIIRRGFQQTHRGFYRSDNHNIRILSGDLNFRIELPREQVLNMINNYEIPELLQYDQLTHLLGREAMHGYQELPIKFPPSYKFNPGSDQYDTSKKMRTPSWCDRILGQGQHLQCARYESLPQYRDSDHKPVCADFKIIIRRQEEDAEPNGRRDILRPQQNLQARQDVQYAQLIETDVSTNQSRLELCTNTSELQTNNTDIQSQARSSAMVKEREQPTQPDYNLIGIGEGVEYDSSPPKQPETNLLDL